MYCMLLYNYTYQINTLLLASLPMFKPKFLRLNYLVLSVILVRFISMTIDVCWIKISFSSNPESFQILADEIVNSSKFKSRDFTKKCLMISKGQPKSVYQITDTTMTKRKKVQKEKQRSTKHTYKAKGRVTRILPFRSMHEIIDLQYIYRRKISSWSIYIYRTINPCTDHYERLYLYIIYMV